MLNDGDSAIVDKLIYMYCLSGLQIHLWKLIVFVSMLSISESFSDPCYQSLAMARKDQLWWLALSGMK